MRRMTPGSTQARRRAVAPVARRLRAETSGGRNPRLGPRYWTESLRVVVRTYGVTRAYVLKTRERGVVGGALEPIQPWKKSAG
jgi:hypothetical protein